MIAADRAKEGKGEGEVEVDRNRDRFDLEHGRRSILPGIALTGEQLGVLEDVEKAGLLFDREKSDQDEEDCWC